MQFLNGGSHIPPALLPSSLKMNGPYVGTFACLRDTARQHL